MAKNAYFIRKGVVLDASLRKLNSTDLIPIKNIVVDSASDENLDEIIVPSLGRTIQVINSLKDVVADVKYYAIVIDQLTLPSSSEIQSLYNSQIAGDALLVQDTSDNAWKALSAFDKTVEILNNDGTTTTLQTIRAELNDGILYLVEQTGVYETAIFTAKGWQLDQTKNVVPAKLEDLYGKTTLNANEISILNNWKVATDQRLSDEGVFITNSNNKDIISRGTISFSGTPNYSNKIPTRADVGSGFATLKQNADALAQTVASNKQAQDALKVYAESTKAQSDTDHADLADLSHTINDPATGLVKLLNDNITKTNEAFSQAQDYATSKADFMRLSDSKTHIENNGNIAITENGANVEVALTADIVAGLETGRRAAYYFLRDNVTPNRLNDVSAQYNNGVVSQSESIVLEGVIIPVTVSVSNNKVIITGLTQAQRTIFTTNYRLTKVEQASASTGASVDSVARADAQASKVVADRAEDKANTNTTAITLLNTWKTTHVAEYNALNAIVGTTNADGTKTGLVKAVADGVAKDTSQDTEIAKKQNSSDQSLTTTDKTIAGSINEINAKVNLDDSTLVALETALGL